MVSVEMAVLTSEQMLSTDKKNIIQNNIGKPPPKYQEIDAVSTILPFRNM